LLVKRGRTATTAVSVSRTAIAAVAVIQARYVSCETPRKG
jgi:hypothetical protein